MMLFQMACHLKRPLCRQLILCHSNQICRSHVNQFSKHQVALYSQHSRLSNIDAESDILDNVNNNKNKKINNNSDSSIKQASNFNDLMFSKEDKHGIAQLYPAPLSTLTCFYNTVKTEFKRNCISFTYKDIKESKDVTKYQCTIQVIWPFKQTFTGVALKKTGAANYAAMSCLKWLHQCNKIANSKPVLYNRQQIVRFLGERKLVGIDLHSKFKNKIKHLIDIFEHEIKSKITSTVAEQDENNLIENIRDTISDFREYNSNKLKHFETRRKTNIDLPIMNYKTKILNSLENNQVLLIKGDTGCGKSTQVPQIIIDEYIKQDRALECKIIVSQPRRMSAISLAKQVAFERDECVGNTVGYHVRFENVTPLQNPNILYCTTGVLLQRLKQSNFLKNVSHVIIDEAHERSVDIDILMKYFKDILKEMPHLKLIIMSASINAELFQQYFLCTVIEVPGSLYPVKMNFLDDISIFKTVSLMDLNISVNTDKSYNNVARLIQWIIENKPPGSILCFLPGWPEIKKLSNILKATKINNLSIIPLHSNVSTEAQERAFAPPQENITKVILSTNVAETGVTIPDISYIIDTAIQKHREWNSDKCLNIFSHSRISKANILQRKGRAGRVKPGESYHLITREEYEQLDLYPKPAILRESLERAILLIKVLTNKKVQDIFPDMIESPSTIAISKAVTNLCKLGILDEQENFTSLGRRVAYHSLPPTLSKAIILSCVFQCLNPIITIIVMFSQIMDIAFSLNEDSAALKAEKLKFHETSDHIAVLKYIWSLENCKSESIFAIRKFRNVQSIEQMQKLLVNDLIDSGMLRSIEDFCTANEFLENNELIRAILFSATNHLIKRNTFGNKYGYFSHNSNILLTENMENIKIVGGSVNSNRKIWPSNLLTYVSKMEFIRRGNSCVVQDTSMISPLSVLLFCSGNITCSKVSNNDYIKKDEIILQINDIDNVKFYCKKEIADLLLKLRSILWDTVNFIIKYEGTDNQLKDLTTVKEYKSNLINLISNMLLEAATDIDGKVQNNTNDDADNIVY